MPTRGLRNPPKIRPCATASKMALPWDLKPKGGIAKAGPLSSQCAQKGASKNPAAAPKSTQQKRQHTAMKLQSRSPPRRRGGYISTDGSCLLFQETRNSPASCLVWGQATCFGDLWCQQQLARCMEKRPTCAHNPWRNCALTFLGSCDAHKGPQKSSQNSALRHRVQDGVAMGFEAERGHR
jgi:hypothetical protein